MTYIASGVFITIWVGHGQDVDVEVVDDVLVVLVVLDELANHECGDGIGNPLTCVNS